ncbi:MAG: hypothetical protein NTV69_07460 [Caldilinea sp.]|jgi:hypothetical protein|nr:hypothetical protein [Caldilinea sp.]
MAAKPSSPSAAQAYTWKKNSDDIIVLTNCTSKNFILELPSGRCRLDAGRRMRTLRSILQYPQIQALVNEGSLTIE